MLNRVLGDAATTRTITANYQATFADDVILCGAPGLTVTLPAGPADGDRLRVVDVTGAANPAHTIQPFPGTTLFGAAPLVIQAPFGAALLYYSATSSPKGWVPAQNTTGTNAQPSGGLPATFTINEVTGNDRNPGTPAAPLKTWSEVRRRVFAVAPLVTRLIVDVVGHLSQVVIDWPIEGNGTVHVRGVPSFVRAGQLGGYDPVNRPLNRASEIVDPLVTSWTPDRARAVRILSGPSIGARLWVAADRGAGRARVSVPSIYNFNLDPWNVDSVPLIGNESYQVETFPQIDEIICGPTTSVSAPAPPVILQSITTPEIWATTFRGINLIECSVGFIVAGVDTSFLNCCLGDVAGTGLIAIDAAAWCVFESGLMINLPTFGLQISGHLFGTIDGLIQGCGPMDTQGNALFVAGLGVFDSPSFMNASSGGNIRVRDALYGSGNTICAFNVDAGSEGLIAPGTLLSIQGGGAGYSDFRLAGRTAGPAVTTSPGRPYSTNDIPYTFANLGAAAPPVGAGFGGAAHDPLTLALLSIAPVR